MLIETWGLSPTRSLLWFGILDTPISPFRWHPSLGKACLFGVHFSSTTMVNKGNQWLISPQKKGRAVSIVGVGWLAITYLVIVGNFSKTPKPTTSSIAINPHPPGLSSISTRQLAWISPSKWPQAWWFDKAPPLSFLAPWGLFRGRRHLEKQRSLKWKDTKDPPKKNRKFACPNGEKGNSSSVWKWWSEYLEWNCSRPWFFSESSGS